VAAAPLGAASLTLPDGPKRDNMRLAFGTTNNKRRRGTFWKNECAFLGSVRYGSIQLTRGGGIELEFIFAFDELERRFSVAVGLGAKGTDITFLIVGRETPARASSGWATIHSYGRDRDGTTVRDTRDVIQPRHMGRTFIISTKLG
jgi:hypothetical protein